MMYFSDKPWESGTTVSGYLGSQQDNKYPVHVYAIIVPHKNHNFLPAHLKALFNNFSL